MDQQPAWKTARGELSLHVPRVMGILNITPDSFSDGGRFLEPAAALAQVERLLQEGADLIDIGGESTRPGAGPVSAEREKERVLPLIRAVLRQWPAALLSIDTVKAEVARAALGEGAAIVNDVSGLRLDPRMADVIAAAGAGAVLMHSRGSVEEMANYATAVYGGDPLAEICAELQAAAHKAEAAGIRRESIVLDPGLGFSKRTEHSLAVIAQIGRIRQLGYPVLTGPSRKRFVGELTGGLPPDQRLEGTIAACVAALLQGARIFRVHDVGPVRKALLVAEAIRTAN